MTNPSTFTLPSGLPVMTFQKAVQILTLYLKGVPKNNRTDFEDALTIALFTLRLLERGDLTYEPLP